MTEQNKCPECGRALPPDASAGLCPACLLKRGLETNTIGETAGTHAARWNPPSVEEVAARFPELDILELIGRGGMGAVYKAREKHLDRLVALKILPPEIGREASFAQRFAREAQAMAKLSHPNIVTIYSFGSTALTTSGQREELYFFLMEYVDGLSLRQVLTSGGVSAKEALAIVPQICDALQYAHDRGIVHRDIKPENILLNKQGQVKIADFGLAKLVGFSGTGEPTDRATPKRSAAELGGAPGHTPNQTAVGGATERVCGTPQYMAPEQVERPAEVDHRADIYSLGVVFYQMLTGELPKGQFEPPSHKVLIDVRLDEVVLRALEKEPSRRYQQVSEVKTEVETIVQTSPVGRATSDDSGPQRRAMPALQDKARSTVQIPAIGLLVGAGISLAVLFALLAWVQLRVHSMGRAPASSPAWRIDSFFLPVVLFGLALNGAIVFGAIRMMQLRNRGLAIAAAILAMIASPGNIIGLPMGIWALVVLCRREIVEAFASREPSPASGSGVRPAWHRWIAVVGTRGGRPVVNWPGVIVSTTMLVGIMFATLALYHWWRGDGFGWVHLVLAMLPSLTVVTAVYLGLTGKIPPDRLVILDGPTWPRWAGALCLAGFVWMAVWIVLLAGHGRDDLRPMAGIGLALIGIAAVVIAFLEWLRSGCRRSSILTFVALACVAEQFAFTAIPSVFVSQPGVGAVAPVGRAMRSGSEETSVRQTAEKFLTALRDKDLEAMKSLSLGSVRGWVSEEQSRLPGPGQLPGLSVRRLEKAVREMHEEVYGDRVDLMTKIDEVAVDGDWAAVKTPPPPRQKEKYIVYLFTRTQAGWYFVLGDDARKPLAEELAARRPRLRELSASPASQPTTQPGGRPYRGAIILDQQKGRLQLLDLRSGEILEGHSDGGLAEYYTRLGKGDLAYDSDFDDETDGALLVLRGGSALRPVGREQVPLERLPGSDEHVAAYAIVGMPDTLVIRAGGGNLYEVRVVEQQEGLRIEYRALGQQPATQPDDESAVRQVAGRLTEAIRAKDIEAAKALSVGSAEGWLKRDEVQALHFPNPPVGWTVEYLRQAVNEINNDLLSKDPQALKTIAQVLVRDDFAGVYYSERYPLLLVFKRTAQGWRIATIDDAREPLDEQLDKTISLLRAVRPATQPATRPADESGTFDVRLEGMSLGKALDTLARQENRNVVLLKGANGSVTLQLHHVTFEQAMGAIVQNAGLTYREIGGIIYVGTAEQIEALPATTPPVPQAARATAEAFLAAVPAGNDREAMRRLADIEGKPTTQPATQATGHPAMTSITATEPGRDVTLDLGNKVTMKLVLIPPGKFLMGSPEDERGRSEHEGPQHNVTISRPFLMGVTEVTHEQYKAVMGKSLRTLHEGPDYPVEKASWLEAAEFCEKASQITGKTVRLPTEAEWEYACRAGSTTAFCFGDNPSGLDDYAWYDVNNYGTEGGPMGIRPVARKKPNAFGLYDMHGNVDEWCADWFAWPYPDTASVDPKGPASGELRVIRGGSCYSDSQYLRSAWRDFSPPRDRSYGFRVVVELPTAQVGLKTTPATQPASQPALSSGPSESGVLATAMPELLAEFVVSEMERTGQAPPGAMEPSFVVKFFEDLHRAYPRLLQTSEAEEAAFKEGRFDDGKNRRAMAADIEILKNAGAALPAITGFLVRQFQAGKLSGAELEVARRLMDSLVGAMKTSTVGGASAAAAQPVEPELVLIRDDRAGGGARGAHFRLLARNHADRVVAFNIGDIQFHCVDDSGRTYDRTQPTTKSGEPGEQLAPGAEVLLCTTGCGGYDGYYSGWGPKDAAGFIIWASLPSGDGRGIVESNRLSVSLPTTQPATQPAK